MKNHGIFICGFNIFFTYCAYCAILCYVNKSLFFQKDMLTNRCYFLKIVRSIPGGMAKHAPRRTTNREGATSLRGGPFRIFRPSLGCLHLKAA